MATRTRDTAPSIKEKKVTTSASPQTGLTQQRTRRSLNPSTTTPPAQNHRDSTAAPPQKPIPNYLKPTGSSRLEASNSKQQGKKPAVSTTDHTSAQKPTLIRRRSFEKPPPKAQISRTSANPTLRSSSFSGKIVSSPKGVLEKNLKPIKDNAVKQPSLYARPVSTVKKSSVQVKKKEIGSSGSTAKEKVISPIEKVDNVPPNNVAETEKTQPGIQEVFVSEGEEEKVHVEDIDEKGCKDLVVEDQEQVKIEQTETDTDNDVKIVNVDLPTVIEEDTSIVIKTEDKPHIAEININKDEVKENTINIYQSVADSPNEEKHNEEEEETNKNEETGSEIEAHETYKATEVHEVIMAVEEKKEQKIAVISKPKAQTKRESAVSNDVIEETASKLREQRKNKVRALAGAFETVISLQDK